MASEIEQLRLEINNLQQLLKSVQSIASEALQHWDDGRDMKVGKILRALSGELPGYRVDTDLIDAAITKEANDGGVAT
jgi:hypothetical protein